MRKLVLHIGYPKTASTTLQESVFLKLHEKGLINFLGRTVTSTHKSRSVKTFKQDWVVDIRKHIIQKAELPRKSYKLSDKLVNVLSDEELTMPAFLNLANFGTAIDPLEYTDFLKSIFTDADEIVILLSIRNQASLIPSLFVQKYRFIYKYFPGKTFDDFIFSKPGVIRNDVFNTFNFLHVVDVYKGTFGAKIIPLVFEDLKGDIIQYSNQISSLIGVKSDLIVEQLKNNHHRNKRVGNYIRPISVLMPNFFGRLLERLMGKANARNFFTFRWYLKSSYYYNLERKFFLKRILVDSPIISNESKSNIKNAFSNSNLDFCKSYGLDIEKLRMYNYF